MKQENEARERSKRTKQEDNEARERSKRTKQENEARIQSKRMKQATEQSKCWERASRCAGGRKREGASCVSKELARQWPEQCLYCLPDAYCSIIHSLLVLVSDSMASSWAQLHVMEDLHKQISCCLTVDKTAMAHIDEDHNTKYMPIIGRPKRRRTTGEIGPGQDNRPV